MTHTRLIKSVGISFLSLAAFTTLGAQQADTPHADEIQLPEMTTVISGDTPVASKKALPDFSDVLTPDGQKRELPALSESEVLPEGETVALANEESSKKDIFVEGLVGGGYPSLFMGDFTVYKATGENPFTLHFGHESSNGYARNDISDHFSNSTTTMYGEKTVTTGVTTWNISGGYDRITDGLQQVSPVFDEMNKQKLFGGFTSDSVFDNGISFLFGVDSSWYTRYDSVIYNASSYTDAEKEQSIFTANPMVRFGWSNESVDLGVQGLYTVNYNVGDSDAIVFGDQATHRAAFKLDAGWHNDIVAVYEKAGVVIGSEIGDQSVLVPFTVGGSVRVVTPLSDRKLSLTAEGGMLSEQLTLAALETKYAFTYLTGLPGETSDWYGKGVLALPIADKVTLSQSGEYRKTAFENGVWQPVYNTTFGGVSKLYGFTQTEMTRFKTVTQASLLLQPVTLTIDWTSNWKDVPVLEYENTIGVTASVQDTSATYGGDAYIRFELDDDADDVPVIGGEAFYRVGQSVRLAAQVDDIVKLISGKSRTYAGDYIRRSGSAAVVVKFFF